MTHIELFAGCGGLSLGLEACGFRMLFANELSPMAAETFSFNLLNENLAELASKKQQPEKTLWINSLFPREQLDKRLRENPQLAPVMGSGFGEVESLSGIRGKLLVGSIVDLNTQLNDNREFCEQLRKENVDLVSGGPPCQSFSMAGLRDLNNTRNSLPMEFANFVEYVEPKIALLENVSGILRPFTVGDKKHYAWFEVARAFASKGYYPICLHVNAKYVGAAQNRPRFVLIALRSDVFDRLLSEQTDNDHLVNCLDAVGKFCIKEKQGAHTAPFRDLNYYDLEKNDPIFESDLLKSLCTHTTKEMWVSVKEAIDDLRENRRGHPTGTYARDINKLFFKLREKSVVPPNHEHRRNSELVKRRFKLYQIISKATSDIKADVVKFLKDPSSHTLDDKSVKFLLNKKYLVDGGKLERLPDTQSLVQYLAALKTKKQTQRALVEEFPAPAALSIPDDACHYHETLFRTLTVREMARFQSFPDWFEFRSKVTTGGQMRKFEVPQYTQVGNAVPPLLANSLGLVVNKILCEKVSQISKKVEQENSYSNRAEQGSCSHEQLVNSVSVAEQ